MSMKLYANPAHYKTKKIYIAAKYVGIAVDVAADANSKQAARIPVLETPQGCIFSSMAILRYLARIRRDVALYGNNLLESGQVDSWVEFCTHELEVPLLAWMLPATGALKEVPQVTKDAKEDVKKALTIVDRHLKAYTYMAAEQITIADICLCSVIKEAMDIVFDDKYMASFSSIKRWFDLCMKQEEFKTVLGAVKNGAAAKAAPQEQLKAEKPKEEKKPKGEAKPKEEAKPKAEAKAEAKKESKKDKKEGKKEEKPAEAAAAAPAEKTPEELAEERKKKQKKVIKEGGKRGVEIEGAADMGGLKFFSCSVDEPEGDLEFLEDCMNAMNAQPDPSAEERKGCSSHIGKMIFSAGPDQLAVLAYVPEAIQGEINCEEWLQAVLNLFGGKIVKKGKTISTGHVLADSNKNVFPLKIREPMIVEANNYLRKKGLFPEDDDDDDDEMVFGDDDFPS